MGISRYNIVYNPYKMGTFRPILYFVAFCAIATAEDMFKRDLNRILAYDAFDKRGKNFRIKRFNPQESEYMKNYLDYVSSPNKRNEASGSNKKRFMPYIAGSYMFDPLEDVIQEDIQE